MTEPAPTRVCTLCHAKFAPRTARGLGCGVYFVVFVGVVALDAGLRPGPLISLGLGLAAAVVVGWVLQRLGASRERTCTSCGSQQTVPLESPAAAVVAEPAKPKIDPLTGVPVQPTPPSAPPPVQPPQPRVAGIVLFLVLLALLALIAHAVRADWG